MRQTLSSGHNNLVRPNRNRTANQIKKQLESQVDIIIDEDITYLGYYLEELENFVLRILTKETQIPQETISDDIWDELKFSLRVEANNSKKDLGIFLILQIPYQEDGEGKTYTKRLNLGSIRNGDIRILNELQIQAGGANESLQLSQDAIDNFKGIILEKIPEILEQ
ncbi:hypothetical protein [Candidatus Absconditicoccus praedator]|uniref:hypothetical protein n=1 Tax=Candidatus Absconditicoccus praedator TaxID=2735562 RepID=UPI001E3F4DF9|nr:hypothetical protein [Candidatus Absconditicoccus praedator]UFX82938.1 hypothetical protein HLG78_02280 [Candidatus Absconditicoccus praedator]